MRDTWGHIATSLRTDGHRAAITSIEHLGDLENDVAGRHGQGLIDDGLYGECLGSFRYQPPASLPAAKSVIVVAFRQPRHTALFRYGGRGISATVPPTYIRYRNAESRIRSSISAILAEEACKMAPLSDSPLPLKTLAVRSGLAEYGVNNICYVDGMGSYFRLTGFYTDLACPEDHWRDPVVMDICEGCSRCTNACPTGAIHPDRMLLHAERCLTYLNESTRPFPEWVASSWHNCLIGCMLCQRVCPGNGKAMPADEPLCEFTEEETRIIMDGAQIDSMPERLAKKITDSELLNLMDVVPRNLRALFGVQ